MKEEIQKNKLTAQYLTGGVGESGFMKFSIPLNALELLGQARDP